MHGIPWHAMENVYRETALFETLTFNELLRIFIKPLILDIRTSCARFVYE